MEHQTLPNILLSDASLVTKSYIARFVDDDAFNPSALSNCSTGLSPQLAHGKSTLSPSQANAGCRQPGLFSRFRSISEQTVHRSRKIRAQCERPPIHVLKTQVSCPRCSRNGTFVRAFVIFCRFWAFARRFNVRDCTPHRLLMRPCWCLTGQGGLLALPSAAAHAD